MLKQIQEIKQQGFRPVIFIESSLANTEHGINLIKNAKEFNIPIFNSNNLKSLHRLKKVCVLRYGHLPQYSVALVKRKGGVVVPGIL